MKQEYTNEFFDFRDELNKIAKSESVQELKQEIIKRVLIHAAAVPAKYDNTITNGKAKEGTIEGAIVAGVTLAAYGILKSTVKIDPAYDVIINVSISGIIGTIVHSLSKAYKNWRKHKEIT